MASTSVVPRRSTVWAAVAGIGSAGFLVAGQLLLWRTPEYDGIDAVPKLTRYYLDSGNRHLGEASALMHLASALLFAWFLVALIRIVRDGERRAGRSGSLPTLMLAGGTVFMVFIMLAGTIGNLFGISANYADGFPVEPRTVVIAILLLDMSYASTIAAMVGVSVLLFALWRAVQTGHALPGWLGWFAFVLAILCLAGPFGAWLTPLIFALWMLAACVVLLMPAAAGPEVTGTST
ncbi:hypothetical protein F4556_005857 [Kitasatospora gansuensis]|uniref:DUF4386 family protein n=1 Tax=Kitasatospora gansuensis TaxID=258050 RepID=A0A7W7WK06_9ACTN|nr:hypothetical protein [Kitasatospora gansuensis]MBB4950322.1 hypothetical protein [Kitasatospora gansuensis]